jgi:hypothetical protein
LRNLRGGDLGPAAGACVERACDVAAYAIPAIGGQLIYKLRLSNRPRAWLRGRVSADWWRLFFAQHIYAIWFFET